MSKYDYRFEVTCAGCKEKRLVRPSDWRKRKSDYCGPCMRRARVGLTPCNDPNEKGTPLHGLWMGMRQRCGHKAGGHAHDLKHYAERGITVCEEWRSRFLPFKEWALANGYAEGLMIDRKDNDLGYSPHNCRWVSVLVSNRNKRTVLPQEDRAEIRRALSLGVQQRQLARAWGLSEPRISIIKREIP